MNQHLPILNDDLCAADERDSAGFGALKTAHGCLPLARLDVRASIVGLAGEMRVEQTFVNTSPEPAEATYLFPLPDRAAVTGFEMRIGERVIEGVLQERGQARRAYDQAIRDGHRASIAEENRPDVFSMRVGNLMPGDEVRTMLTLVAPLEFADGQATFRFPLVVAPRYIPGEPLPGAPVGPGVADDTNLVPDASQISPPVLLPGFANPVRLSLAVEIDSAGLPIADLAASLHAVETAEKAGRRLVRLVPGERLNRDFILRWTVGHESLQSQLILVPDQDKQQGTFQLTLVPPAAISKNQTPRDVVLLLDRSGSMSGWKIVAARRAAARIVDSLAATDRFAVLAFDTVIDTPQGPLQLSREMPLDELGEPVRWFHLEEATDRNRFRAVEFLSRLDARGGTEMAAPLTAAAETLAQSDPTRNRVLVLVTDGQVAGEDHILAALGPAARELRIFTVGIDQAVNAGFLRRLAALGGGTCELVESEDRLDAVMDLVHRRISAPLLTGVRLAAPSLELDDSSLTPSRTPDLHLGVPLVLMGRYRPKAKAADGPCSVSARDSQGGAWTTSVRPAASENRAITALWARGHIRDLEDRYAAGNADLKSLEERIVAISLAHKVLSRFTAFLAVDRSAVVNPGGAQTHLVQPVEMPAGWAEPAAMYFTAARGAMHQMPLFDAAQGGATFDFQEDVAWRGANFEMASDAPMAELRRQARSYDSPCLQSPPDLAPYRARVDGWLAELAAMAGADDTARYQRIRQLLLDLDDLLEDMRSILSHQVVLPLVVFHRKLEQRINVLSADAMELAHWWQEAQRVLGEFAQERPAFWKK